MPHSITLMRNFKKSHKNGSWKSHCQELEAGQGGVGCGGGEANIGKFGNIAQTFTHK